MFSVSGTSFLVGKREAVGGGGAGLAAAGGLHSATLWPLGAGLWAIFFFLSEFLTYLQLTFCSILFDKDNLHMKSGDLKADLVGVEAPPLTPPPTCSPISFTSGPPSPGHLPPLAETLFLPFLSADLWVTFTSALQVTA